MDIARGFVRDCPRRDAGTPGGHSAARWIFSKANRLGCDAQIDRFTGETPDGVKRFANVRVELPSPDPSAPWIILSSHFDTKAGLPAQFTGANDGASSTALLLELAHLLRRAGRSKEFSIEIAWFDGEECAGARYAANDGLHGSRHEAARFKKLGRKVAAMLNFDMIGDRDLSISVPLNSTESLRKTVLAAAEKEGLSATVSLSSEIVRDDHESFLLAGFPAADLIDFEFGSAPGLNDWWHTVHDNIDNVSAESLAKAGRLAIAILRELGYKR